MPVREGQDAVHPPGQFVVMGRHERRSALGPDGIAESGEHRVRGIRIEIPGRFVGQQHMRRIGQRPGNRDALLFPPDN